MDIGIESTSRIGTATRALVATDIVGSTPLVCRLGDENYQQLIEAHDRLLLERLVHHGGEHLRSCGDGMLVAYRGTLRFRPISIDGLRR